ncbi:MAG: alpha-amylase [Oscillospiraceae bacterium]|nr:alpha-amylase [Oscillospiraceae bacterium]
MITKEKARVLRKLIEQTAITLSDEEALEGVELFPMWKAETAYALNDRVQYNDVLYKCVQAHSSQSDWTPDVTPALWTEVSIEEWPEWKQPTGAQDAYAVGDKVSHNDKHWISDVDANVWEPGVYGWTEHVDEDGAEDE